MKLPQETNSVSVLQMFRLLDVGAEENLTKAAVRVLFSPTFNLPERAVVPTKVSYVQYGMLTREFRPSLL